MRRRSISAGTVSRYLDGQYAEDNPTWGDEDAFWKASKVADFLRDEGVAFSSVCEIGCGAGGVLAGITAAMPAANAVGYDISPQAVELARQFHPEIDVRLGAAHEISESFDLVMLIDVFEHVEDYLGLLRGIAPLGRRLLCHIPLDMTALMVARNKQILRVREQVGHLHYFSKDTAIATLRDAGYDIDACRYTAGTIESAVRSTRMKIAKWPRRAAFRIAPDLTARTLGGYSLLVLATPKAELRPDP
jgi:cyclopropane fatty-acyl-phospholipid synthase-like methyltransferase